MLKSGPNEIVVEPRPISAWNLVLSTDTELPLVLKIFKRLGWFTDVSDDKLSLYIATSYPWKDAVSDPSS